jgi:hypothetical protein
MTLGAFGRVRVLHSLPGTARFAYFEKRAVSEFSLRDIQTNELTATLVWFCFAFHQLLVGGAAC